MRNSLIIVTSLFLLCGLAILVRGKGQREVLTESQVDKLAPLSVGDFHSVDTMSTLLPVLTQTTDTSYKMEPLTYQTLEPFGICCRVMLNAKTNIGANAETYDTVFIVGDGEHTFHTPEICFTTQGNEILKREQISVPTMTRGNVPATLLEVKNEKYGAVHLAAFTFQGPKGMKAVATDVINDMLINEFFSGKPQPAAFYRFISQNDTDATDPQARERLIKFMGAYLDEIHKTSGGKF
jgi:hypothetical protein